MTMTMIKEVCKYETGPVEFMSIEKVEDICDDSEDYISQSKLLQRKRKLEDNNNLTKGDIEYIKYRKLLKYEQAPLYLQHNSFIRDGYRKCLPTNLCWESIFWWTNETLNIWTHLFGFFLVLGLTVNDLIIINIHATFLDKVVAAILLMCFLELRTFYMTSVTLIFVIAMVVQMPSLKVPYFVKLSLFVGWAAYGVLPTLHWTYVMGGFDNSMVKMFIPRVIGMYLITGTAFAIYAFKIPERWFPGKMDYIGHSHQWWHLLILGALYFWHNSGMMYVQYRMNHGCANTMRIF